MFYVTTYMNPKHSLCLQAETV